MHRPTGTKCIEKSQFSLRNNSQKGPFCTWDPPLNILSPSRLISPNAAIESAVFAEFTIVSNRLADKQTDYVTKPVPIAAVALYELTLSRG